MHDSIILQPFRFTTEVECACNLLVNDFMLFHCHFQKVSDHPTQFRLSAGQHKFQKATHLHASAQRCCSWWSPQACECFRPSCSWCWWSLWCWADRTCRVRCWSKTASAPFPSWPPHSLVGSSGVLSCRATHLDVCQRLWRVLLELLPGCWHNVFIRNDSNIQRSWFVRLW